MNDLELEALEGVVEQLEECPKADPEGLRALREKVLTLKLLHKLQAGEEKRLPFWQSEWFWRLLVLLVAIALGVTDVSSLVKGWFR